MSITQHIIFLTLQSTDYSHYIRFVPEWGLYYTTTDMRERAGKFIKNIKMNQKEAGKKILEMLKSGNYTIPHQVTPFPEETIKIVEKNTKLKYKVKYGKLYDLYWFDFLKYSFFEYSSND